MRRLFVISSVLVGMVLTASLAQAKVIYIDDDAVPGGDGSSWTTAYRYLQNGLAAAKTAGGEVEIRVAQGVYKPDRSTAKPEGTRNPSSWFNLYDGMSLVGGYAGLGMPDPNARDVKSYKTILSGDLAGNDVEVQDPCDLRDEPTRQDNSAMIWIRNGTVRLEGCVITSSQWGVWSTNDSSVLTIIDCTFTGHFGFGGDLSAGGAITFWSSQSLTLIGCSFTGNATGFAGGAVSASGDVILDHCEFSRNWAGGEWGRKGGGAVMLLGRGRKMISNCTFTNNEAIRNGGAIFIASGDLNRLSNCVFRKNSASYGGAIYSDEDAELLDCVIVGNKASRRGGGCFYEYSQISLNHCILCGNWAGEYGGAVAERYGLLTLSNCSISGNLASQGRFLASDTYPLESLVTYVSMVVKDSIVWNGGQEIWNNGRIVKVDYTDIRQGPDAIDDPNNDLVWGLGNIEADPCFADPGHWDANGTPEDANDDFFIEGDYHLKSQAGRFDPVTQSWVMDDVTSPCVDTGDPNTPIGQEFFPNGGRINMGAYGGTAEASKSYFGKPPCETIIAGDINGDCRVDAQDLAIIAAHWLESN